MTAVTTLLAGIKTRAEGLTDLCSGYLQQGIRHVQRNCDIECRAHEEEDGLYDCNQPDRYDGGRMAEALASIPRLVAALEAVEKLAERLRDNRPGDPNSAFDRGYATGRRAAGDLFSNIIAAALGEGEGQ